MHHFGELGAGIVGGAVGSGDICGFGFGLGLQVISSSDDPKSRLSLMMVPGWVFWRRF